MSEKGKVEELVAQAKAYVAGQVKQLKASGAFSSGVDEAGKKKPDHAPPDHVLAKLASQWWAQNAAAVEAAFLADVS